MGASVSAGEEAPFSKKRRLSVENCASPSMDHIMDSFPGTPMSMCSESSATNKIKLKIKVCHFAIVWSLFFWYSPVLFSRLVIK